MLGTGGLKLRYLGQLPVACRPGVLGVRVLKLRYLSHTFQDCLSPEYSAANSLDSGSESASRIDIMNWINFVWGPRAGIILQMHCKSDLEIEQQNMNIIHEGDLAENGLAPLRCARPAVV